jgi:uncharacterized membrane protein (UPF0127 family)
MSKWRILKNATTGEVVLPRVKLCDTYLCHLKGLQFTSKLPADQGLLFVTKREGVVHTSIHMFFVFYSIAVIWIDAKGQVVDKKLAKPWRPFYASSAPAQYYLEADPALLERVQIGDHLSFNEVAK